jgi:hypothetical protein
MGASARPHQLLAQGGEGLLLSSLHSHRADLQQRRGGSQGEPLEDGEPQGRSVGCGQLLHQLLQRRPGEGGLQRGLSDGCRELLQPGELTGRGSIDIGVVYGSRCLAKNLRAAISFPMTSGSGFRLSSLSASSALAK